MNYLRNLLLILTLGTILSCNTQKAPEYNYMKNIDQIALESSVKNSRSTIQPGDQLVIFVSAKDMDVTKPFNKNYSSASEINQYSMPSSNSQPQQMLASGPSYQVDTNGNIDFPVIGMVDTTDLTTEGLRDKLANLLTKYIKNPTVDVKTTNFKVTVGGEVNKPGTFVVPDGNATLLSVLGLAGDLTMYGVRQDVLVVRNVDGQMVHGKVDLTSADFINSPFYYLKQNDYIYVAANQTKEKTARLNPNTSLYIGVAGIAATIVLGVFTLLKN